MLSKGRAGEKYNIGDGNERTNLEIVDRICEALEELRPAASNQALKGAGSYQALRSFVSDRPGHDRRYAIDASKIAPGTRLAAAVREQRQHVLAAAYVAHPERFVKGRPHTAELPQAV